MLRCNTVHVTMRRLADVSMDVLMCRVFQELTSVGLLEESLTLLLSGQPLPQGAAARLAATLAKTGALSTEQLRNIAESTGRTDELEDVISTINQVGCCCMAGADTVQRKEKSQKATGKSLEGQCNAHCMHLCSAYKTTSGWNQKSTLQPSQQASSEVLPPAGGLACSHSCQPSASAIL